MEFKTIKTRNRGLAKREAREVTGLICNIIEEDGKPLMFESFKDAKDYLETLPVITKRSQAVRYMEYRGTEKQNQRILRQEVKVEERKAKVEKFVNDWLDRVKNAKSKTKGCKECGKRFATEDLEDIFCPNCNSLMLSNGDKKRYNRLLELLKKDEDKLQSMIDNKGGYLDKFYLVGFTPQETGIDLTEPVED